MLPVERVVACGSSAVHKLIRLFYPSQRYPTHLVPCYDAFFSAAISHLLDGEKREHPKPPCCAPTELWATNFNGQGRGNQRALQRHALFSPVNAAKCAGGAREVNAEEHLFLVFTAIGSVCIYLALRAYSSFTVSATRSLSFLHFVFARDGTERGQECVARLPVSHPK